MAPVPDGSWVEDWLSAPRFETYLRLAGHDRGRALALYEWSARLNAALLHDFAHLEVGLRNMYDRTLMAAVVAGDDHWLDAATAERLFPRVGTNSPNERTHRDIETARGNAGGATAPPGKIVAELMLGFWVYLTARRHEPFVWVPHLAQAYPNGSARGQIHRGLAELLNARNRVAHHEPANAQTSRNTFRQLRRYANYVSPELGRHLADTSAIETIIRQRP